VSEMTRDELKFSKFIRRQRNRFSALFDILLEKQLILKGIVDPNEFNEIKNKLRYDFMKDNYFEELKQTEILREKITMLRDMEEQVGKYYSREWVVKNVLFMNDDELREMEKQMKAERAAGMYDEEMGFGQIEQKPDNNQQPQEPDSAEQA
jgi:hypothetical protein